MIHLHYRRAAPWLLLALLFASGPARAEIKLGGFADVVYYGTDEEGEDVSSGFDLGQFVLHLNSPLSDRLHVFAEVTWTPGNSGYGTEVERVMLRYEYRDAFKPSAGRYHTPISWWNVAFHHGAWLQTTVDRPIAVRFGSPIIPIHFVGALAEGKFFPGGLTLSYNAGLGNGRGENNARGGDAGDVNNHRALLGGIGLRHDALYDLQVGGAIYVDKFPIAIDGTTFDERILSAYLVYSSEKPEILAEFFHVRREDQLTGAEPTTTAWYAQAAYRLPVFDELLKPYVRYEDTDIDDEDRALSPTEPDLKRFLAGVRADVATAVALKLEWRNVEENEADAFNEIYAALNFVF